MPIISLGVYTISRHSPTSLDAAPPIVIVVGFGIDYDVFLVTRIREEREHGWDDQTSIVRGVARSGGIISYAGAIQAIAFGGLLKASLPLLNQLSMIVVMAVIVDTFIVRAQLVPALMAILGPKNWWPGTSDLLPIDKTAADDAMIPSDAVVTPPPAAAAPPADDDV